MPAAAQACNNNKQVRLNVQFTLKARNAAAFFDSQGRIYFFSEERERLNTADGGSRFDS